MSPITIVPFNKIVDELSIGVLFVDANDTIIYCNEAEAKLRGVNKSALIGKSILECHQPEVRGRVKEIIARLHKTAGYESPWMHKSGSKYIVRRVQPLFSSHGKYLGLLFTGIDMTTEQTRKHELEQLVNKDGLTGLLNQRAFQESFSEYKSQLKDDTISSLSLLVMDMNGLKTINDTQGHEAGDEAIQTAARIIQDSVRQDDPVFRIGGDEFAIIMANGTDASAQRVSRKIKSATDDWSRTHPELPISLGIGWSTAEEVQEATDLFEEADQAMYEDKDAYRK